MSTPLTIIQSWTRPQLESAFTQREVQLGDAIRDRDRYLKALNRLLVGDHVGTPINQGCGAMKVIEDAIAWTDAEVEQFLKEYDEGKHQLSAEDQAALDAARPKLFARIRERLSGAGGDE